MALSCCCVACLSLATALGWTLEKKKLDSDWISPTRWRTRLSSSCRALLSSDTADMKSSEAMHARLTSSAPPLPEETARRCCSVNRLSSSNIAFRSVVSRKLNSCPNLFSLLMLSVMVDASLRSSSSAAMASATAAVAASVGSLPAVEELGGDSVHRSKVKDEQVEEPDGFLCSLLQLETGEVSILVDLEYCTKSCWFTCRLEPEGLVFFSESLRPNLRRQFGLLMDSCLGKSLVFLGLSCSFCWFGERLGTQLMFIFSTKLSRNLKSSSSSEFGAGPGSLLLSSSTWTLLLLLDLGVELWDRLIRINGDRRAYLFRPCRFNSCWQANDASLIFSLVLGKLSRNWDGREMTRFLYPWRGSVQREGESEKTLVTGTEHKRADNNFYGGLLFSMSHHSDGLTRLQSHKR